MVFTFPNSIILLIFYVAGVLATNFFGGHFDEWFGSVGRSMYSLFQIMTLESLTKENLGNVLKNVESVTNIKGQNLWLPLRYAITLEVKGPDLKLIVDLFGKEKCSRLVKRALEV